LNPNATPRADYGPALEAILERAGHEAAWDEIRTWPGYRPTPLLELEQLARDLGLARLWYKDEAHRFHLESFKALGGAYAVLRVLQDEIRRRGGDGDLSSQALRRGDHAALAASLTVTSATDGNHGRSVAWGAEMFGCPCVIYIHEGVSQGREAAIARFGAEVRRVPGSYDDSVRQAALDAQANGWHVVSDTSYEGYDAVPRQVMQGYTVMAAEAAAALPADTVPSHLFIQGGVGGLAAAVTAHFWQRWGGGRPRVVVVEPVRADCLYQSAMAGRPAHATGDLETVMAGLSCGEISTIVWPILAEGAAAFMTIPDEAAIEAMRRLAEDEAVVGGESGVAGLAGLIAAAGDPASAEALGLDANARVLLVGSEGATDPELYRKLVGRAPEDVRGA
jgi:diaminopropionate ammonia-lyase